MNKSNKKSREHKRKNIKKGGKNSTVKFKTMNCSPAVKDNTPVKGSCFTQDVLQLLKKSYNKFHKDTPILNEHPRDIWRELKQRLRTCNKEDCWLDEIEDPSVRKKIDKYIFAPDQPAEWKKNSHEWLSNYDIIDVLQQYKTKYKKFHFTDPSPIDFDTKPADMNNNCVSNELCTFNLETYLKKKLTKIGVVFNIAPHTSGGSHWVSLFIDLEDQFIFYMDSAGNKMPSQIKKFIDKVVEQGLAMNPKMNLHIYENCPLEHQFGTSECGMYALYFIITMLTNKVGNRVFQNYHDKISYFKDKRINDRHVYQFRKIYFNE
jgi:hypothetical protein